MARNINYHLDIEIDRLTNSIQNTISGDSFATEVMAIANVDLNLEPMPLSSEDRQEVSAIIAQFKSTGEIPTIAGASRLAKHDRKKRVKKLSAPKATKSIKSASSK